MLIVGFNGGYNLVHEDGFDMDVGHMHDSAAVLVDNGRVVAGIEQERLDRIKHSNKVPIEAIRFCLDRHGVRADQVDAFAYYATKTSTDLLLRQNCLKQNLLRQQARRGPALLRGEDFFSNVLSEGLGQSVPADRIRFVHHHVAHLVSAFAGSGFERSLLLSIDGSGDGESGRVAVAQGGSIETIQRFGEDLSLGNFYYRVIRYIGFTQFDAYKAMGLAPYGDPARFRAEFKRFYTLLARGAYKTAPWELPQLFDVLTPRRKGEPFTQTHMDLAAALQETLETIVFHVLGHYRKVTGHTHLCLAGGVAHNCTMNGKIAASGMFERVFVQPAAHDAGCALGAALASHYDHKNRWDRLAQERPAHSRGSSRLPRLMVRAFRKAARMRTSVGSTPDMRIPAPQPRPAVAPLDHVYWGTETGPASEVRAELERWRPFVDIEYVEAIEERAAALLAGGNVIGWVQGRSEFGPRALGNRSILADARPAHHKELINAMVKKREGFRPFAPSVLEEDAREYFSLDGLDASPYMIFVVQVREDKRALLGAVTHVDGSARVQTVSRRTNPRYWRLIDEFKKLTGVPVVLNTSFNNHAEPIVDSTADAVACFLTTSLHHLIVGDYLVSKGVITPSSYRRMIPRLPRHLRLAQIRRYEGDRFLTEHAITSTADPRFQQPLSAEAFDVLSRADGAATLDQLVTTSGAAADGLLTEIADLWSARAISLAPHAGDGPLTP